MSLLALDTIGGLPAHPLLVHIPVVLVPVTAVVAFCAIVPKWRTHALWAATITGFVAAVGIYLAADAGDALEHAARQTATTEKLALIHNHTQMADGASALTYLMFLCLLGWLLLHIAHNHTDRLPKVGKFLSKLPKWTAIVAMVVTLVASAGAVYKVAQVGHSGAKASWYGVHVVSGQGD
jgi:hypothetical protein